MMKRGILQGLKIVAILIACSVAGFAAGHAVRYNQLDEKPIHSSFMRNHPTDVLVLKLRDEVMEGWHAERDSKPIRITNSEGVGQVNVVRTYYVENLSDAPQGIYLVCQFSNQAGDERNKLLHIDAQFILLRPRQKETVRVWADHFSNYTEVYFIECKTEQIETNGALFRL